MQDPADVALRFLETNAASLGAVDPVTVRIRSEFPHQGLTHVTFHQFVGSLRVVDAIYAVTLDGDNQIVATSGRLYGVTDVRGSFALDEGDVIDRAMPVGSDGRRDMFTAERAIMGDGTTLRYVFVVTDRRSVTAVDAETGLIVARRDAEQSRAAFVNHGNTFPGKINNSLSSTSSLEFETFKTSVDGYVFLNDPISDQTWSEVALPRLAGDGSVLSGQYVRVTNEKLNPNDNTAWHPTNHNYKYPPDDSENCNEPNPEYFDLQDCSHFDDVNVYYHVDRFAHEYWNQSLGLNLGVQVNAKSLAGGGSQADDVNAVLYIAHESQPIAHTYHSSGKVASVIYHEYSHLIHTAAGLHAFLASPTVSSAESFALEEGYADYFAASFRGDPKLAKGLVWCRAVWPPDFVCDGAEFNHLRALDTDPEVWSYSNRNTLSYNVCSAVSVELYPPDQPPICLSPQPLAPAGDSHTLGMIWGGALWDLRASLGAPIVDRLALKAILMVPGVDLKFEDHLAGLLMADFVLYGGAHGSTILSIMAERGIVESGDDETIILSESNVDLNALLNQEDLEGQHVIILPGASAFIDSDLSLIERLLPDEREIPATIHVLGVGSSEGVLDVEADVTVSCEGESRIVVQGGRMNYADATIDDCGVAELIIVDGTNVDINALLGDEDLEGQYIRLLPGATAFVDTNLAMNGLSLGGGETVPSTIEVLGSGSTRGVLTIATEATLTCDNGSTLVADGGTITVTGAILLNCEDASLHSADGGHVSIMSNLAVTNDAFLSGNGTFEFGDNVSITYDSDRQPSIGPGATFQMGEEALLILDVAGLQLAGSVSMPIVFEASGPNRWQRMEVRGDDTSIRFADISGAEHGLYVRADNVSISNVALHENHYGLGTHTVYGGSSNSSVILEDSEIFDNDANGLHLYKVNATLQYNDIHDNSSNGVYASSSGLTDTWENEIYGNDRGVNFYNSSTDADAAFYNNYIHDNNAYGVYLSGNSELNAFDCCNNISENGSHEIFVNGSSSRFYPSSIPVIGASGLNDIYDANPPGGTYLIVNSASGWAMPANGNYWGTASPTSSLFGGSGSVDYTPYLTSSPATGPGGNYRVASASEPVLADDLSGAFNRPMSIESQSPLRPSHNQQFDLMEAIRQLRAEIENSVDLSLNGQQLIRLYEMLRFDPDDETHEREQSLALVESFVLEYLKSERRTSTDPLTRLGEAAMLVRAMAYLHDGEYAVASTRLATFIASTQAAPILAELNVLHAIALEQLADFDGAMVALEAAEEVMNEAGMDHDPTWYTQEKANLARLKVEAADSRAVGKSDQDPVVAETGLVHAHRRAVVTIHPNPSAAYVQLDALNFSEGRLDITIFDVVGREVVHQSAESTGESVVRILLNTQRFAPGLYLVRVVGANGGYVTSRFIKSR